MLSSSAVVPIGKSTCTNLYHTWFSLDSDQLAPLWLGTFGPTEIEVITNPWKETQKQLYHFWKPAPLALHVYLLYNRGCSWYQVIFVIVLLLLWLLLALWFSSSTTSTFSLSLLFPTLSHTHTHSRNTHMNNVSGEEIAAGWQRRLIPCCNPK